MSTIRLKNLPIGIQTFGKIIEGNFLYIDKTKYIYELVKPESGVCFLSRPRRFGKSLLVSTLAAIFQGKKELFQNLWIGNGVNTNNYEWNSFPVIHLSMPACADIDSKEELMSGLINRLENIATQYNIQIKKEVPKIMFENLIIKLSAQGKVVVLIDEYDKPIIDTLTKPTLTKEVKDILKGFYTVLKDCDQYLRFIFLTGVSRFSKVSVFSGLNNLRDISFLPEYSPMLGYTQEELEKYFPERIQKLAEKSSMTQEKILEKIKLWYNGYRFSSENIQVYNPFSTLLLFDSLEFKNHWFETATPTFLVDLMTHNDYRLSDLQGSLVSQNELVSYELDQLPVLPLMLDTGYLTIQEYHTTGRATYTLGYPNEEVSMSFMEFFINRNLKISNTTSYLTRLLKSILNGNLDEFFEIFKEYYREIPYDLRDVKLGEKYYHSMFYAPLKLLGMDVNPEERTNIGKMDLSLVLPDRVYIFEFKVDQPVAAAIKQIKDKKYHEKYQNQGKEIILVGVSFSSKSKNIDEWGSVSL